MQRFYFTNRYYRHGYTLFELMLLLALLCGVALVYFERATNVTHSINVMSVNRLETEVRAIANLIYSQCHLHPDCDISKPAQTVVMEGKSYALTHGWLDAGDALNGSQIDAYVNHEGFMVELVSHRTTGFMLADAPDPVNCALYYHDAWHEPVSHKFFVTEKAISGC